MSPNRLRFILIASALLAAGGGAQARQAITPPQHQRPAADTAEPQGDMMAKCKAAMANHDKMMADMKAADERLDGLAMKMASASGPAKVDATAAVVSELVTQRKAMRDSMMKMHHETMGHLMDHMQAGKESMAMCPMMKGMGGMKK